MLIVKRPFRNYGTIMTVGTVITDPTAIKHYKSLVGEGKIISVTEADIEVTRDYFLTKHGVDILSTGEANDGNASKGQSSDGDESKGRSKPDELIDPVITPNVTPVITPNVTPVLTASVKTTKAK